ncbi:MAG: hypothetical protein PVG93_04190 [Phycisphaerales bacterium]|jgi:hypothetical protein
MKNRTLIFMAGLVLGISVVLVSGAAYEQLRLSGELAIKSGAGIYQPAFSGVATDGTAYLAITNTTNGKTEVFGITEYVRKELKDLPGGRQGSVVLEVKNK